MFGFEFSNTIVSTSCLQIKLEKRRGILIFFLQGEFSGNDSKIAMDTIFDSIQKFDHIIFNCKHLEFVDAYSMRKILELYERVHRAGFSILFTNISLGIKGIMRSNGVLDIIAHYPNEKLGIRALERNDFSDALPVYPSESKIIK